MLLDQILSNNSRQIVKNKSFLEVTNHTVQLEDEVYQFRNVTGFGVGIVKTKGIPLTVLIVLFLIATSITIVGHNRYYGYSSDDRFLYSWIPFVVGLIHNLIRPKIYGLSLCLNSGHEKILVTKDRSFLTSAVRTLKDFMENPVDGKVINISLRNMKGNITIGDNHGRISSN
jgi:hypothetical protein